MPSNRSRVILSRSSLSGAIITFELLILLSLVLSSRPTVFTRAIIARNQIQYHHPGIPQVRTGPPPPLQSSSYILLDNETNTTLIAQNPNLRIYPASTTKLATALTALNIYPLNEVLTVGATYSNGKIMGLQTGEKITILSLVSGLLVYSANDAAYTLAAHHPLGIDGFLKEMNLVVSKYGLKGTHFANYDGIHSVNHYSTVANLAQLARLSIKNSLLRDIVKTQEITVSDVNNQIQHPLRSTNELLGVTPEIEGLKTGWTPEAGGSFIGLLNLNGHYLISVVAQSPDRFADTKSLLDWAKSNVVWQSYQP